MQQQRSFLSAVIGELTRRKVLRTVGAYAVAVFAVLQLMDAAVEPLRLPDWLPTLMVIGLILGFPLVFMLAWEFDFTTQGIRRTQSAGLLSRTQHVVLFSVMLLGTATLGLGFYKYYAAEFESGASQQAAALRAFAAPENSIAVLPFADLSELGNQAHFSDGIAEEILNMLAQIDGLHVAARTSSFAFRDPQSDIREIGRLLNVSTVLEGSIRTAGNRIRMTAQLINVADGYHIWSQSYDRELTDVFDIQDEVASAIAKALVKSFAGLSEKPASRTNNLAAFEAYRTGRLHWWRRNPDEIQLAIALFAQALEHDPGFAPAYAAIADSLLLLSSYGNISQMRAIERAQPMIEKALELDPESAEAFAALGLARWQIGQFDAAESSLRQAVALNEDYVPARLWLSGLLGDLGRIPEQGQVLQQAMAVDPLNELLAINFAGNLYVRGETQAAHDLLLGLVQVKPDSTNLLRTLAGQAAGTGKLVEAWRYAQRSFDLEPNSPVVISAMARVWLDVGEIKRAETLLLNGLEQSQDNTELQAQYFFLMLSERRLEDAVKAIHDQFGDDVDSLPARFQRFYHFQSGLVAVLDNQPGMALEHLELAIDPDARQQSDGMQVFILTMVSWLQSNMGNSTQAEQRLAEAERAMRRARINGLDDAGMYYTEATIYSLRGQSKPALEALQTAYERGWRHGWLLELDMRLAILRDEPGFIEIKRQIKADQQHARAEIKTQSLAML